jgi:hypothetical protein
VRNCTNAYTAKQFAGNMYCASNARLPSHLQVVRLSRCASSTHPSAG